MGDSGAESKVKLWLQDSEELRSLGEAFGAAGHSCSWLPEKGADLAPGEGELVLLCADGRQQSAEPFMLCSQLKLPQRPRLHVVFLAASQTFDLVEPIACFCLADATIRLDGDSSQASEIRDQILSRLQRPAPKLSTDALLASLEGQLGGDPKELADRVLTGLSKGREENFVAQVTDPESGLFDGPFMAFKLEEEFKRSWRFRTPLTVALFDLPGTPALGEAREEVFGRLAGVFLNECRDIDIVGRFDATSFLLLLPHTGGDGARVLAARMLEAMREVESPVDLDPAVALVTVPRHGVDRRDELLDLVRLTLIQAWSARGGERIQVAH